MRHLLLSCLLLLSAFHCLAQQSKLEGIVLDEQNRPIAGAKVDITQQGSAFSDDAGQFSIYVNVNGKIGITISHKDFETYIDTFTKFANQDLKIEVQLFPASEQLDEFTIIEKSDNQKAREQAIKSIVIDTRALSTQAVSITDLMNRSTGVRIRQNGGIGSQPEISVNGFQGKAIKYFKDGIPMNYLGEGYNIAALPLDALERVEIYKGVLPVHLGADALGGAVNLVSANTQKRNLNTFYEFGSFNTHRVGANGAYRTANKKWLVGASLFYNYSTNNYKAKVNVIDPITRNPQEMRLSMFHNAYSHYYGEAFVALQNQNWADEFRLSFAGFLLDRQVQHPALMTDAYGALRTAQNTFAPSLRYKKQFWNQRFAVDQFVAFNVLNSQRIDTLQGNYDWMGNFTPKTGIGESRLPSQSRIVESQITWRSNFKYQINDNSSLDLNYVLTIAKRNGTDPYGAKLNDTGIDLLSEASIYRKQVLGLGWNTNWMQGKLQNDLIAKLYHYQASGIQNTWNAATITSIDRTTQNGNYWGIAEAIKYQLNSKSLVRASAEYAYRLPERDELFGNNIFIVPNFELKPEKSLNLNMGYRFEAYQYWTIEANSFFRNTRDLILLVPIQAPNAQYRNQEQVHGFGFDLDVNYYLSKHYKINTNATWQDLRLFGITNAQDTWKNSARLRNTPYFFANAGFNADYKSIIQQKDVLKLYINYNFLREFYLETIPQNLEPSGILGLWGTANLNTRLIIPNQHLLNIGFTYKLSNNNISIGGEIRNLLNHDVFDYYRVQRPGTNASIKLSYHL